MSDRKDFCQQCGACPNAGELETPKKLDDGENLPSTFLIGGSKELESLIEEITKRVLQEIQTIK